VVSSFANFSASCKDSKICLLPFRFSHASRWPVTPPDTWHHIANIVIPLVLRPASRVSNRIIPVRLVIIKLSVQ
jgi:hypothetical protein